MLERNGEPEEHALKLAVLFNTAYAAMKELGRFSQLSKPGGGKQQDAQWVHDACLFTLPTSVKNVSWTKKEK